MTFYITMYYKEYIVKYLYGICINISICLPNISNKNKYISKMQIKIYSVFVENAGQKMN